MLIQGTVLTDVSPTSATVNPAGTTSIFGFVGNFEGHISLQARFPGSNKWFDIITTNKSKMYRVSTPVVDIDYRITSKINSGTAAVYFG